MTLKDTYKIRYKKPQRRRWEAAAKLTDKDLAVWIRDRLDLAADVDISNPPK